jgi:hypothetical protein
MENIKESIENIIKENLKGFDLSQSFGQRSVGDKIEDDCAMVAKEFFPANYASPRSKKSTEDFALSFGDKTFYFDVKTHFIQETAGFSMPNLASIDKLRKLLEDDKKSLLYIFVDYKRTDEAVTIESVVVKYVWELDWSILGIGALGKGQLQIKNANNKMAFTEIGKKEWLKKLKEKGLEYNRKQLIKIEKEIQKNWA